MNDPAGKHPLNQAFVDPHLISIPRLTPLTAGGFASRDLESLGRQAYGAFDPETFRLRTLDEFLTHFLQRLNFPRRQGDSDLVDLLQERYEERQPMGNYHRLTQGRTQPADCWTIQDDTPTGPSPKSLSGFW